MRAWTTALAVFLFASELWADGLSGDSATARSVGRAGATLISDDSTGAVWQNPAALSRRNIWRVQLGARMWDTDLWYQPQAGDVEIADRAAPVTSPNFSLIAPLGRIMAGVAYVEPVRHSAQLGEPDFGLPESDVSEFFPHRYGGSRFELERRAAALSLSLRVNDWLAIGAGVGVELLSLQERRRLWVGFSRDAPSSPSRDIAIDLDAQGMAASGTISALLASLELPLELAFSMTGRSQAQLEGDGSLSTTRQAGPRVLGAASGATVDIPAELILRSAVRVDIGRVGIEGGANVYLTDGGTTSPSWQTPDLSVQDEIAPTLTAGVETRSRLSYRSHGSVQGAIEVEAASGFLFLVLGYRFHTASSARGSISPAYGDTGGHTVAFGAEIYWNDIAFTAGYSRDISGDVFRGQGQSLMLQDNPFPAPTELAAPGRYDRAADSFGLTAEIAWE